MSISPERIVARMRPHTVLLHCGRHQDDEGAGGAADLEAAAAQQRHHEAADDRCVKTLRRCGVRADGDGHREGQRDNRDGQARHQVSAEIGEAVTFPEHRHQLRREELRESG
jgi:hypothetical protein